MKKQQGFTLIELVVVIIILGILAVTAAPKFINLQGDARISTLEGARGAMQGANSLVFSRAVLNAQGNAAAQTVILVPAAGTVDAITVTTDFGTLNASDTPANLNTNLRNALDMQFQTLANDTNTTSVTTADWGVFRVDNNSFRIVPSGRSAATAAADACNLLYTEAASAAVGPTYVLTTTGC
jgi:MSHA pilin protein MshA